MTNEELQTGLWDAVSVIDRYYEDLLRPVAARFDVTVGQLRLLHVLHRFGAMGVGELARVLGMARTNASSLCKKLCKRDLLIRTRGGAAGDERQVFLELTAEGLEAAECAQTRLAEADVEIGGRMEEALDALQEFALALSPQAESISRLARWKARFTPSEHSRTSKVFQKARRAFGRKQKGENL